jgi:hypothetical protein
MNRKDNAKGAPDSKDSPKTELFLKNIPSLELTQRIKVPSAKIAWDKSRKAST